MSIREVSAEQLARLFLHYHQALAPDFNCLEEERAQSWQEIPANRRGRFIAAARLALLEIVSTDAPQQEDRRKYFAKPGSAEWGC